MRGRSNLLVLVGFLAGCTGDPGYPAQCGQLLPGWVTNEHGWGILGMSSDIHLRRDGQVLWNRKPITNAQLRQYSRELRDMNPRIFVTFAVDEGTQCEQVRAAREAIDAGKDCNGENRNLCGEGPGPWPIFGDVPPFPIVEEYKDGKYRWVENNISDEEWRAKNVRPLKPSN
jgi:hypothetical protein